MKVSRILGGLAVVAMLGGCTQILVRPLPKGVGFTGVGFQAAGTDTSYSDGLFSARREVVAVSTGQSVTSTTRVGGNSGKARQAMRISSIANAKQVSVNNDVLYISLQTVEGTQYAVAEKRKRIWGGHTMKRGTDRAFLGVIQSATGCAPVGGVWRWGPSPNQSVKLAAEVNCG